MDKFEIKSKVYCPPSKKDRALYIAVNIAVVFLAIFSIVSLLVKGVKIGNLTACIVAIAVGIRIKSTNRYDGHYDFCVLSITFKDTVISISYQPNAKVIDIPTRQIRSLQYSDQLQCVRIVSDYTETISGRTEIKNNAELLLYITYEENVDFYNKLQCATRQILTFVDR